MRRHVLVVDGKTFTAECFGNVNVEALERTLANMELWELENTERVEEEEVAGIVRRYVDTGELRSEIVLP